MIQTITRFFIGAAFLWLTGCSYIFPPTVNRYINYPVKSGDTLYEIGQRFDVTVADLNAANDIDDPRALRVGQYIKVPYHGQSLKRKLDDTARASMASTSVSQKPKAQAGSIEKIGLSKAQAYVGRLQWPVSKSAGKLSSRFGWRWFKFHEGVDISGKEGTAIHAAHAGTVVYSGNRLRGYGNLVIIRGDGLVTVYGHNRKNRVKAGEYVRKGEHIADLGQTGHSTGPHCHFETRIKESSGGLRAVDPLAFFP